MTKGQQAIRDLVRASHDSAGNLPPLPGIFSGTNATSSSINPEAFLVSMGPENWF
jgi:hypothetical protein